MRLAVFGRKIDSSSYDKLELLIKRLSEHENVEFFYNNILHNLLSIYMPNLPKGTLFTTYEELPNDIDLFLALGGDGTFLESITWLRGREIPVAGINFGRLGFLTTAKVEGDNGWIEMLMNREYEIEDRALLQLSKCAMPNDFYPYALNEIAVHRTTSIMLEIEVKVDGNPLPKYFADGVVVSTSTGSTAYSLSIGGPIVSPKAEVFIMAPIAPHNLNVRPLVIPNTSVIEISYKTRDGIANVFVDNRSFSLPKGEVITISKANSLLKRVSINNNFIAALNEKLLWGADKRNSY